VLLRLLMMCTGVHAQMRRPGMLLLLMLMMCVCTGVHASWD